MVRALAYHQCVPGSIPGHCVICGLSFLLVLALAPSFSLGSLVFLPPQKPTCLNSNSIGNSRATGLSVEDCCVSPSLNEVGGYLFIYLFKSFSTGFSPISFLSWTTGTIIGAVVFQHAALTSQASMEHLSICSKK